MPRRTYVAPELMEYGGIAERTFTTPSGKPKGGDPCFHIDKYEEMSGLSPSLCQGQEPPIEDPT